MQSTWNRAWQCSMICLIVVFFVFAFVVSVMAVILKGKFQQILTIAETDWERDFGLEIQVWYGTDEFEEYEFSRMVGKNFRWNVFKLRVRGLKRAWVVRRESQLLKRSLVVKVRKKNKEESRKGSMAKQRWFFLGERKPVGEAWPVSHHFSKSHLLS